MSELYAIVAIMKKNPQYYKLCKEHTSLEKCKSVRDILSLIGEPNLCVDEVHANVGLMEGYANDQIAFSRSEKIDPAKPIDTIAYFLASEVVLTSDDVSIPDTVLKAGTWVVILDIFGITGYEYQPLLDFGTGSTVRMAQQCPVPRITGYEYQPLLDFGYSLASIDKWHATLTPEQLTLSVEERMELISIRAFNTL
jgi:hypothetical protein